MEVPNYTGITLLLVYRQINIISSISHSSIFHAICIAGTFKQLEADKLIDGKFPLDEKVPLYEKLQLSKDFHIMINVLNNEIPMSLFACQLKFDSIRPGICNRSQFGTDEIYRKNKQHDHAS